MLNVTVSGSFHRHLHAIMSAVQEFRELDVKVLSPEDPRIVDAVGDFLFVASDRVRSVRMVQDRHVECIRGSDFLWLVAPDGYVGQSAAMELGFAVANEVPILGQVLPTDLTLRQYVRQAPSVRDAVRLTACQHRPKPKGFLIDARAGVQEAHDLLVRIDQSLSSRHASRPNPAETGADQPLYRLREMFSFHS